MDSLDPARALDDEVAGCAAAHQALLSHLDVVVESGQLDPARPSLLPDWSLGHVLTHLARNANANQGMIEAAARGESARMYPSAEYRNDAIVAGSTRTPDELLADLRSAIWSLESSWANLSDSAWAGHGFAAGGEVPVLSIPRNRWREVEIHHADLGLDFEPKHWSPSFVALELSRRLPEWLATNDELPAEVCAAPAWQRLAWLFGRDTGLATPPARWG